MSSEYAIHSGKRVVATRKATSAREAALDYVRSMGCKREEITSVGADTVAWRGAFFRAVPLEPSDARAV